MDTVHVVLLEIVFVEKKNMMLNRKITGCFIGVMNATLLTHVSNIFSARSFLRVALKIITRVHETQPGLNCINSDKKINSRPPVLVDKLDNVQL